MIKPFIIILLLILIYILYYSYDINCPKINLNVLYEQKKFKTGDIILFKKQGSIYNYFFSSFFNHIGIVYVDPNEKTYSPKIFEILYVRDSNTIKISHYNQFHFDDLYYRMIAFKGHLYYKELNKKINEKIVKKFKEEFIDFAMENMYYEIKIPVMLISRKFLKEPHHYGTNCADIVLYSLIKLNLISYSELDNPKINNLNYLVNLKNTHSKNYFYKHLTEILIFDY